MKKLLLYITALVLLSTNIAGQDLRAYLSYSTFNTPDNEPYIETYLTINGNSINYIKTEDETFQGTVDVQILFKLGDSIVNFAKYDLASPNIKDTTKVSVNMLDVQRYSLPSGEYNLEISLKDANSEKDPIISYDKFSIDYQELTLAFSDIELLSSYNKVKETSLLEKNGYELTPNIFNYYPQSVNSLSFYAELYNSLTAFDGSSFLLTYYIRPFEVDKKLDNYFIRKKVNPEPVVARLSSFDISELPSGNYVLVFEAINRNNQVVARKETFFQRHNPNAEFNINNLLVLNTENTFVGAITDRDTLETYIKYLSPISTDIERNYAISLLLNEDDEKLRKYFLNFWMERNQIDPQLAWSDYLILVNQVNESFRSVSLEGYETDRGRVYLQYGQPNVMSEQYFEPAAYPYEIWHYYTLNEQRDKKFVFYTHDLVTNDFQLLHSNAIGELSNYRWQTTIYRRTWDPHSLDDAIIPSAWGSKATETYRQPW